MLRRGFMISFLELRILDKGLAVLAPVFGLGRIVSIRLCLGRQSTYRGLPVF